MKIKISNSSRTHHSSSSSGNKNATPHLKGSYVKTCSNIKYTGTNNSNVSGYCKNKKGKKVYSTIPAVCNDSNGVNNCDGKLKCGKC